MEVFYNAPPSKFYWKEFREKVLCKKGVEELKRRMIVYDYKELSQTEIAELGELVEVHTQVMNKFY